jgi:uncharacterized integral membrane protein
VRRRSGREATRLAVAVVVTAFVAIFAVLNTNEVEVNWILGTWRTPLILVIVVCLVIGAAIGFALGRIGRGSAKGDG